MTKKKSQKCEPCLPLPPPVPPQVSLVVTEEHWGDYLPLTIPGSVSKVQMHLKSVFANCSAPCYIPSFKGLPELQSGDREEKDDFDWRNCVKKEAAPTLISSVALHHLAFKAGKGTGEGGEKRTAEERQTDREQQKYWFPSPCLFRWLAWDGLIPGAASHTICLLSHISAPSLRRFKMVVFSSQLMPSERIIWGFSVFDILTTLLLSSRGVPQIFILKRKKKKNKPRHRPSPTYFLHSPHCWSFSHHFPQGTRGTLFCLFMYFFLAASLLQHPKKGAKTFEEIIHKRLPCTPIHSALAMCWWLMDSHIPCHCWLHSGHPTNICVLLAWGHSYLRRGQGKDPPSTKAFWSETHRKSTRSSVFVAPSRGEKSWENDTISELLLLSEMLNVDCQNPTVWTGFGFSLTDCRAHLQVWQVAMYLLVDNFGE